jgi:hypothetical protein
MKRIKKILIISAAAILVVISGAGVFFYISSGKSVQKNIGIAQAKYPGTAEDALIAFLLDTNNSMQERSHLAIWSLGQIKSEKAIPVLKNFYKNDPEGKTCKGRHNEVLCQYEIYKALNAAEVNWLPLHARLNK